MNLRLFTLYTNKEEDTYMSDKAKRPYVKPSVLFILEDSPEYKELIEKLENSSVPEMQPSLNPVVSNDS